MKKHKELPTTNCLNCDSTVSGDFCQRCGQRVRDNTDRSLGRLLGEFFGNIFFVDSRFFLSVHYLFRFPGRMTVEFLEGKRKKFISPVTLFLFFNLIYFFVNPSRDYSLSLYDQRYSQPYSKWTKEWVDTKLQEEKLDEKTYGITYQNASDDISKSIMIINVPIIASFVFLMAYWKRRFYFDTLIFSFHFFSLLLICWVLLGWMDSFTNYLTGSEESIAGAISAILFSVIIPISFSILSIKKFLNLKWYLAILAGIGVIISWVLSTLIYRFIIFNMAFWTT